MWEAVAASVKVNPPEVEGREVTEGEEAAEEGEEEAREAKTQRNTAGPKIIRTDRTRILGDHKSAGVPTVSSSTLGRTPALAGCAPGRWPQNCPYPPALPAGSGLEHPGTASLRTASPTTHTTTCYSYAAWHSCKHIKFSPLLTQTPKSKRF